MKHSHYLTLLKWWSIAASQEKAERLNYYCMHTSQEYFGWFWLTLEQLDQVYQYWRSMEFRRAGHFMTV